ncbi:MAG: hypothetical protein Q9M91_06820 [Candidatus Dojkabacteria bacterium]|nr:hypothetical protein [Candidatus Dojkabacteria bacterium]
MGLDHPPCWSDPVTDKIQYIFNVIINERSVEYINAWPESRDKLARSDPHILKVAGIYLTKNLCGKLTRALYIDSVKNECRHVVRVYDKASSKKEAYKRFYLV